MDSERTWCVRVRFPGNIFIYFATHSEETAEEMLHPGEKHMAVCPWPGRRPAFYRSRTINHKDLAWAGRLADAFR